ncbi:glycosyltransferase family 2 protein [Winogradskyella aurantia]|uniref:Glycosyltransferase 2-like domain-containing protein n=1 Tax=Winogradskyella aurantia TaxID=1915063 RepID=A0A265UVC8_9FLAO|nr:glycosyltransferase family 2 protein [Winogradskyella aurantia]OZV69240.1 hypothetical protein CA834_07225 [Winogradskyella aurantia]
MDVSIIIVNYNTFEVTCNCLASVFENTSGVSFEVIVVDNASSEINPEKFISRFPLIRLIKSKENLGFSGGNNLGIKHSRGSVLLLLNSDTILINNAVKLAFEQLNSDKKIGCLTCSVLNLDKTPQGVLGRFPSIRQNLISICRIEKFVKRYHQDTYKLGDKFDYKTPQEGDWIWGTFFMFSRAVLNQFPNKKLHDDFFMYGEDLQWCMYIKQNLGLKVVFTPEPKIFHLHGASDTRKYIEKYKQWAFPNFVKTLRVLKSDTYAFFYVLTFVLQRLLVRGNSEVELSYYTQQLRYFFK